MNVSIKELINLLNRAAAAIETPKDLNPLELEELAEDLTVVADLLSESPITEIPC